MEAYRNGVKETGREQEDEREWTMEGRKRKEQKRRRYKGRDRWKRR